MAGAKPMFISDIMERLERVLVPREVSLAVPLWDSGPGAPVENDLGYWLNDGSEFGKPIEAQGDVSDPEPQKPWCLSNGSFW